MHTPDAGLIRVRWYAVPNPPPGSYPLTDYSSSNFDADPNSYNPDIGEESSTRQPFLDWRDCDSPPWPAADGADCPLAKTPTYNSYALSAYVWKPPFHSARAIGRTEGPSVLPCFWGQADGILDPWEFIWDMSVQADGSVVARVSTFSLLDPSVMNVYRSAGPVDLTAPFVLDVDAASVQFESYPWSIRLSPVVPSVLSSDGRTGIGTEAGDFIQVFP